MIKGFVSRRSSQRIPFQTDIGIQFNVNGAEPIVATTTNLSPEGVRFFVPKGQIRLTSEEVIELVFSLPDQGEISVQGEICYFSNAVDGDQQPVVYYGAKFINITPAVWNAINSFCQARLNPESDGHNASSGKAPFVKNAQTKVVESHSSGTAQSVTNQPPSTSATTSAVSGKPSVSPSYSENDEEKGAFRSLSQDVIDQIVQSLNPAKVDKSGRSATPVNEVPSATDAVELEEALFVKEFEMTNTDEALAEIKKIAESINLKLDEEFFHQANKQDSHSRSSRSFTSRTGTRPDPTLESNESSADLSYAMENGIPYAPENNGSSPPTEEISDLGFLAFKETPNTSEEATLSFRPLSSSQASLIDILYGEAEAPQEASAAETQPRSPGFKIKPAPDLKQSQKPMHVPVEEPVKESDKEIREKPLETVVENVATQRQKTEPAHIPADAEKERKTKENPQLNLQKIQALFNTANKKSSSVPMDQRMIDQIIQSLTKKTD